MRTFTSFAFAIFFAALSVPAFASAQATPQPNGSDCSTGAECTSGYCKPGNNITALGKCDVNPGTGPGTVGSVTLINPLKSGTSLTSFLNNILDFVINVGSIIVILMLVFVGFKFVVAQGKPAEIEAAKKMLLWTIIGALVLLGAKAISAGILATVQSLGG